MKLVDYGVSLLGAAAYPFWGKLPGVGRVARGMNRRLLSMGATPLRVASLATGAKLRVDLRSGGQWPIFYKRNADRFWIDLARRLLDGDKLFLDIGANIGIYAVQVGAARRIPGQCHAFEPMPGNLARLSENVALNGLGDCVEVHPYGLSDEPKTLQLAFVRVHGEDTGNAEIVLDPAQAHGRTLFDIEVRRLDAVALPDRPIGVIKIDVEGHEDFAYRGGRDRLAKDRPVIIAEYNRDELAGRGLGPDLAFAEHLPPGYVAMREQQGGLVRLADWSALPRVTNFVIAPEERVAELGALGS